MVTLEYPPYEYTKNGEIKGFIVEIVTKIFKDIGYDVNIQVLPWARSLKMLQDGEADAIFTR